MHLMSKTDDALLASAHAILRGCELLELGGIERNGIAQLYGKG